MSLEVTVDQVTSNRGVIEGSMADYMYAEDSNNSQPPNPSNFSRGLKMLENGIAQNERIESI